MVTSKASTSKTFTNHNRRQEAGGRRQEAGGRRQKAEGRRQEAEGRRQKSGGRRQKAVSMKKFSPPCMKIPLSASPCLRVSASVFRALVAKLTT